MASNPPYTQQQLDDLKVAAEQSEYQGGKGDAEAKYSEALDAMAKYNKQNPTLTQQAQKQSQNTPNTITDVTNNGSAFAQGFLNGQQVTANNPTPTGTFPTGVGGQILYLSSEFKGLEQKKVPGGSTFASAVAQMMSLNGTGGLQDLQQQLIQAGLLDPSDKSFKDGQVSLNDVTFRAYESLLSESVSQTGKYKDITSFLQSLTTNNPKGAEYAQKYASMFGGAPVTLTATHTATPSAPDLQGDFRTKLQQLVGADPTSDQYKNFVVAAQAFAKANPELVTTEYTTGPGGSLRYPQQKDISAQGGLNQQGMDQFAESYIAKNMGPQEATAGVNSLIGQFQQMLGVK